MWYSWFEGVCFIQNFNIILFSPDSGDKYVNGSIIVSLRRLSIFPYCFFIIFSFTLSFDNLIIMCLLWILLVLNLFRVFNWFCEFGYCFSCFLFLFPSLSIFFFLSFLFFYLLEIYKWYPFHLVYSFFGATESSVKTFNRNCLLRCWTVYHYDFHLVLLMTTISVIFLIFTYSCTLCICVYMWVCVWSGMDLFTYVEARIVWSPLSHRLYFRVQCFLSLQLMFAQIDWKVVITSHPPVSALLGAEILSVCRITVLLHWYWVLNFGHHDYIACALNNVSVYPDFAAILRKV